MSTMVMCPDPVTSGPGFARYPSPPAPANYGFNGFGYPTPGTQHPQDYNQFQVADSSVQQAWYNAMYSGRPEEWAYGQGQGTTTPTTNASPTSYAYRAAQMGLDYSQGGQMPSPLSESPVDTSTSSSNADSPSNKQLRPPYDWMKKAAYQTAPANGKTRTKDKYRVVYSDHQRLELEKEFHYSRYITIRRKSELAQNLVLSERQVKIWFQNRRAKERKQNKKRDQDTMLPHTSDMAGVPDDNKHLVQQQMNMQMPGALPCHQGHQVHVGHIQSSSPPAIHTNQHTMNPYRLNAQVQGHCHQTMSPPDAVSPVNHLSPHAHYSPEVNHQLPPMMSGSPSCSLSPVTIKTDIDAQEFVSS